MWTEGAAAVTSCVLPVCAWCEPICEWVSSSMQLLVMGMPRFIVYHMSRHALSIRDQSTGMHLILLMASRLGHNTGVNLAWNVCPSDHEVRDALDSPFVYSLKQLISSLLIRPSKCNHYFYLYFTQEHFDEVRYHKVLTWRLELYIVWVMLEATWHSYQSNPRLFPSVLAILGANSLICADMPSSNKQTNETINKLTL